MARKKLIYEVRIFVPTALAKSFKDWLDDHIDDMLSLSYFSDAQVIEGEPLDRPNTHLFVARYELNSKQDLQDYLLNAAPQMRSKLPDEFNGKVDYSRALLTELV